MIRVSLYTALLLLPALPLTAQVRGVYPLGMSVTSAGALFGSGASYVNAFLFYARDELRGPEGELTATGKQTVLMDLNTVAWATSRPVIFGARFAAAATLPIANNSLTSDELGPRSGGGGFADSFFQPLMLGWKFSRADLKAAYGFLAPTGAFEAGRDDNVGSGYWTHVLSSGQTVFLTGSRNLALSTFEMYEWHGTQEGTGLRPGQTMNLDYSLTGTVPLSGDLQLQVGPAGYSQWQTSAKEGPGVSSEDAAARYQVHALGVTAGLLLPGRRVNLGTRYLHEFEARSTLKGYSFQISGGVNF